MARIRGAKDYCGTTLDPFTLSWEDRYFNTSVAYSSTTAFQLVTRMDGLHSLRELPLHKTLSGAAAMLRQSGNILDKAKTICSRSNRVPGFVYQHRVHLLMQSLCRTSNWCKPGLVVGALRIACNGLCTVARFHSAEENPMCR